jgi:Zn-dependent protease
MDRAIEGILAILALICTVIPHEVAHGYVSWKLGDPTAKLSRRLTLNPLRHIDPVGSILVPGILIFMRFVTRVNVPVFGWAKPVPINPWYFREPAKGIMYVSLAGPGANVGMALLAAGIGRALWAFGPPDFFYWPMVFLTYLGIISLFLALINLLPIPPLDGSRVLSYFLPPDLRRQYLSLGMFGLVFLFALLYFTPVLEWLGNIAIRIWSFISW